jgi:hypothetical protein
MCVCLSRLEKMEMCQNVRLGALAFLVDVGAVLKSRGLVAYNDLQLKEVGEFLPKYFCGKRISHLPQIFLRSTMPPISFSCCYGMGY